MLFVVQGSIRVVVGVGFYINLCKIFETQWEKN